MEFLSEKEIHPNNEHTQQATQSTMLSYVANKGRVLILSLLFIYTTFYIIMNHTLSAYYDMTSSSSSSSNASSKLPSPFFNISDSKPCVTSEDISMQIDFIETAYHVGNFRIFPRNGYLLGAIRHSGFLPIEASVDADLGVMYEDIVEKGKNDTKQRFQLQSIKNSSFTYTYKPRLRKHKHTKWLTFDGNDPITKDRYNFMFVDVSGSDGSKFKLSCLYRYYENDNKTTNGERQTFYPLFALKKRNLEGSLKEYERYGLEGGTTRVLGIGNKEKSISKDVGKQNIGTLFQTKWFDELIYIPFYDQQILVPVGYHGILKAFYGHNYMRVEKRVDYEALPVSQEESDQILKQGPLPMCSSAFKE